MSICQSAIFGNQGQNCCAGSRCFVQDKIYDEFLAKSKALAQTKKVGNPFEEDTSLGPLVDKTQFERVLKYIDAGKSEGATVAFGGGRVGSKGYFVQPTIFADVKDDMKIAKEEARS